MSPSNSKEKILVGDLGGLGVGGCYEDYKKNIEHILKTTEWESISMMLNLSEVYLRNYQPGSYQFELYEQNSLFEKTYNKNSSVFLPKELMSQIYPGEKNMQKPTSQTQLPNRNPTSQRISSQVNPSRDQSTQSRVQASERISSQVNPSLSSQSRPAQNVTSSVRPTQTTTTESRPANPTTSTLSSAYNMPGNQPYGQSSQGYGASSQGYAPPSGYGASSQSTQGYGPTSGYGASSQGYGASSYGPSSQSAQGYGAGSYSQAQGGGGGYLNDLIKKMKEEEKARNENKEKREMVEVKTNLKYKVLEKRTEEFEKALTSQNMIVIQNIIKGNATTFPLEDQNLPKDNPQRKRAEIYLALLGLIRYKSKGKKNRREFKGYLDAIVPQMGSEVTQLYELLMFFMTGEADLSKAITTLEIPENILNFLLINIRESLNSAQSGENNNQRGMLDSRFSNTRRLASIIQGKEHAEDENKLPIITVMHQVQKIPIEVLKMIELIRSVYLLEKPGWTRLLNRLVQDRLKKAPGSASQSEELFAWLLHSLDFERLQKEIGSLEGQSLLNFMQGSSQSFSNDFGTVLEGILKKKLFTNLFPAIPEKVEKVIANLINLNFSELFKLLISERPKENIKEVLTFFEVKGLSEKNISLLKIFLTLANKDWTSFMNKNEYSTFVQEIITDITNSGLLAALSQEKETQKQLAQLLIGALTWDFKTILKSLIIEETLQDAYLLYSVYNCLGTDKILSLGKQKSEKAQIHLKVILFTILKKFNVRTSTTGPATSSNDLMALMKQDLIPKVLEKSPKEPEISPKKMIELCVEELKNRVEQLSAENQEDEPPESSEEPKSLIQHVIETFELLRDQSESSSTIVSKSTNEKKEENFIEQLIDICDGNVLAKLVDKLISKQNVKIPKKSLCELILFILKISEKLLAPGDTKLEYKDALPHFERSMRSMQTLITDDLWLNMLELIPHIMKICFMFQQGSKDLTEIKGETLLIIKDLLKFICPGDEEIKKNEIEEGKEGEKNKEQNFVLNLMSVILGLDMVALDDNNVVSTMKYKLKTTERMEIFFDTIIPKMFPNLSDRLTGEYCVQIYELLTKLQTGFLQNFKDPKRLREIIKDLATLLFNFGCCGEKKLIQNAVGLLDGDIEACRYFLYRIWGPQAEGAIDNTIMLLREIKTVLNFTFLNKKALMNSDKKTGTKNNSDEWAIIFEKIKEKTASSKDLFYLVDQAGDKSGTIDVEEFSVLCNRLGFKLSEHRINEIFARVKGSKVAADQALNEREFERALEYLEDKNLLQALQMLGITPEMLSAIFIQLVILLVVIFVFIFLGIKAFAIGGTFGALINSLFPAAGGIGLSQKSQPASDLNDKEVKDAADDAVVITTTENL